MFNSFLAGYGAGAICVSPGKYIPVPIISIELRSGGNVRIDHQQMKLFLIALVMNSRYQHSARLYSHHRTRRKVYYRNARLSHKLFRLVVSMNTGKDRAFFSRTVVKCEFEQLLGLRHRLARKHLDCAEIRTREGFKIYAVGKKRLDLYIGKIDLFLRRRCGNNGLGCFLRLLFTADRLKRRDFRDQP